VEKKAMIEKAYIRVKEGQIHLSQRTGSGIPIVFVHQTASSSKMWHKVMGRSELRNPLVAFDTPGFGGSFDVTVPPTIADYAAWLSEAMEELGIERAHLVGHHTGASIATQLAADFPGKVVSLTVIGPPALTEDERLEFSKVIGRPFTPTASGAHLLETWEYLRVGGAVVDLQLWHRELCDTLLAWQSRAYAYAAVWQHDFPAVLKKVNCPVLAMAAQDDMLHAYVERCAQILPDIKTVTLPEGSNFESDLCPEDVAECINSFTRSII
jgi:pimeloyl-ACP methyl ester carboxylesterase